MEPDFICAFARLYVLPFKPMCYPCVYAFHSNCGVCLLCVDRYSVNFVPRESGLHYVHVKLNGVHVPGSPYAVQAGRVDADASQVTAYGDGLYKGFSGTTMAH